MGDETVHAVEFGRKGKHVFSVKNKRLVAFVSGLESDSWDQTKANARLIASAPDMYDVLRALLRKDGLCYANLYAARMLIGGIDG